MRVQPFHLGWSHRQIDDHVLAFGHLDNRFDCRLVGSNILKGGQKELRTAFKNETVDTDQKDAAAFELLDATREWYPSLGSARHGVT